MQKIAYSLAVLTIAGGKLQKKIIIDEINVKDIIVAIFNTNPSFTLYKMVIIIINDIK